MPRFVAALLLLAAVGCQKPKEPLQIAESELIRLDDAKFIQEFTANRKGAVDRYVNKYVEMEIEGIEAEKTKDSVLKCELRPTQSSNIFYYQAAFDLNDPFNAWLAGKDSKPDPLVVRGRITAIEQVDPHTMIFSVKVGPAWIRPMPPRSVSSILKDNSIQVFCLLGSIFLGVTTFRIAWREDWGWIKGLALTAIIVGLTFLFFPWGLLGAGAIVGKLYQHYG